MKFILGTKKNMTEYFGDDGSVIPVTLVEAGPIVVTRILEKEKDGYDAVQVGFGEQKKERITKARLGQMKGTSFRFLKEFRLKSGEKVEAKEGDKVDASAFLPGDKIYVSGTSKGKGFQGVVKRHGFHGGPRTHGQKHSEREPGSIGGGLRTKVPVGMRMAGRMGSDRITQKNLEIISVDKENNTILVKGAVPGKRGSLVEIVAR